MIGKPINVELGAVLTLLRLRSNEQRWPRPAAGAGPEQATWRAWQPQTGASGAAVHREDRLSVSRFENSDDSDPAHFCSNQAISFPNAAFDFCSHAQPLFLPTISVPTAHLIPPPTSVQTARFCSHRPNSHVPPCPHLHISVPRGTVAQYMCQPCRNALFAPFAR